MRGDNTLTLHRAQHGASTTRDLAAQAREETAPGARHCVHAEVTLRHELIHRDSIAFFGRVEDRILLLGPIPEVIEDCAAARVVVGGVGGGLGRGIRVQVRRAGEEGPVAAPRALIPCVLLGALSDRPDEGRLEEKAGRVVRSERLFQFRGRSASAACKSVDGGKPHPSWSILKSRPGASGGIETSLPTWKQSCGKEKAQQQQHKLEYERRRQSDEWCAGPGV